MAETNGSGRLDRIEKILEMFIADHERIRQEHEGFRQDHKQLLIAQVVQSDQIADLVKVTQEHSRHIEAERTARASLDKRVDDLVSSIGQLIARIPPSSLAH